MRAAPMWAVVRAGGLALAATLAAAAGPPELAVTGQVEHQATMSLAQLQALPPVTVEIARPGAQGAQTTAYTGVPLWALITAAKPLEAQGAHGYLQHTLLARGQDGYAVALAIGEVDPGFEGKQVLVAYAADGKPLPSLRLVVPGDVKAGRFVRDLVAIETR